MAMACKAFWSLDYVPSSHEQVTCKLSLWPLAQVASLSSSSKHTKRSHRSTSIACKARETLVLQSQEDAPSSLREDIHGASHASQFRDATEGATEDVEGGLEADQGQFSPSQEALGGSFSADSSLRSQVDTLQEGGFPASLLMQKSQSSTQVRFKEDEQVELKVSEEGEAEWMKGFPGAKGALVKPLLSESLTYFPEGYLDTVTGIETLDWVTIVPTRMLPKGDRLVLKHNKERVILFWFKDRIYAVENRSPAAPMSDEAFAKAVITEDGLLTCPITESKYDIRTGATVEWLPKAFFLEKLFMPPLSDVSIYAVKASPDHIFVHTKPLLIGGYYPLAEFTGNRIWTGPNYEEPLIYDDLEFGFTDENELTNGRFAMLGFLTLLILEMETGEGLLKGSGILDLLYKYLPGFPILSY